MVTGIEQHFVQILKNCLFQPLLHFHVMQCYSLAVVALQNTHFVIISDDQHHSSVEPADSYDEPLLSAYICQLGKATMLTILEMMMIKTFVRVLRLMTITFQIRGQQPTKGAVKEVLI